MTDLACKPCEGTGYTSDELACIGRYQQALKDGLSDHEARAEGWPDNEICPDCGGSGIAAWAVEAGAKVLVQLLHEVPDDEIEDDWCSNMDNEVKAGWSKWATDVLAAVREEAKNQ